MFGMVKDGCINVSYIYIYKSQSGIFVTDWLRNEPTDMADFFSFYL